jgi:hypothetical protein
VVIARTGYTTTATDCVAVSGGALAKALVRVLVTCTVKLNVPAAVGVPDTVPPADNVRPDGKAPVVTENV